MNAVVEFSSLLESLTGPPGVKLALALLHFLWQGILIAAVAAVLIRLFGRRSSQRRYAIGVAGMALMAVAPVVTFCLVTPPALPPVEPVPIVDASELLVDLEQVDAFLTTLGTPVDEAPVIAPQAVRLTWPERLRLVQPYAVLMWLAGSLLCGLRLVIGAHSSLRCRRGRRAVPEPWLDAVVKAAGRIGLKAPRVFVSDNVVEAVAVGLLRPMVLLPAAWIGRIPPDVLEAVLAHELAHIRRYDLWVNLFQRVVESLLFYHPAVWWLSRQVRLERENCCDDAAAKAVASPAAYARALEYVATERVAGGRTELFQAALAAGMRGEDSMALLNRVHRVLGNDNRPRRIPRLSEGLLALAVPVALWAAVVTIGPAFAQEEPVEAPQTEPTLDDVVEDVYRDFDVQPGKSLDDVIEGLAQNDDSRSDAAADLEIGSDGELLFSVEPKIPTTWAEIAEQRADDELHDALRDLREELQSLRNEVEELRSGKKDSQTQIPGIDDYVIERLREANAAAAVRDRALERLLGLDYAKDKDLEVERLYREQLRKTQQRLERVYQSLRQAGVELPSPPPGVGAGTGDHHYNFTIERGPDGKARIKAVNAGRAVPTTGHTTQIHFTGPAGMTISGVNPLSPIWQGSAPMRLSLSTTESHNFEFSHIPGRNGLKLNARLQLPPAGPIAETFLSKNAVPLELTNEDLDQVESKNIVTKVVYLPNAGADSGIETLVSTRLDAGVNPVAEARRRGAILAVMSFARDSLDVPFQKLTDDGFTPVGNPNPLPAEVTGSDGRRYRAVTEEIKTKDGKSIRFKRLVPVDAKSDGPADHNLMLKYKAAGLVRDAAVRELVEARKQKQNPDVLEHLQKNVDEAQRWLNQLHEELQERQEAADGASKEIHLWAQNPPVIGALIGLPGPPHLPAAKAHDGGKETTSDEKFHSFIDGPGPGVLRREQAKTRDGKPAETAPEIKQLVEKYRQAVKSRDEAARLAAAESQSPRNLAHSQNRLVEAQRELARVQAELERRKILAGLPVGELKTPGDDEPQEASAEVKQLVEEYRRAVKSRDEAARLAASEAAKGVAPSQKRLVEAQRELARLKEELERRKILVGLPVDDAAPADDALPDKSSLRVVKYRVGDLIASGSHVTKPVTGMLDTLVTLITRSVRPSSWEQAGGPCRIATDDKELSLVIIQTEEAHDEIKDLLKSLKALQGDGDQGDDAANPYIKDGQSSRDVRQTSRVVKLRIDGKEVPVVVEEYHDGTDRPHDVKLKLLQNKPGQRAFSDPATGNKMLAEEQRIREALKKPVTLHFDKTPLEHVVATLRNIAGVNVIIDKRGLMEEGISLETPVSVNVDDMPIREVLSTILTPLNLTATTGDGVVVITSRQRAKGPLTVETYPVADLVLPVPDGETIKNKDGELMFKATPEQKQQAEARFKTLIDLITGTIEPQSWEQVGGAGVIRHNDTTLSLVIRQTRDVHEKIAGLLQRLRKLKRGEQPPDKINRKHFTPKETAADTADKAASVKVRVEQEGTYYVDGYAASATGLASAIKEAMADGNRTELVIQADRTAPFSAVARVIKAAKEFGMDKIQFAAEPAASANENFPGETSDNEAKQDGKTATEWDELVSEYNELIKQRNFAEAITIAKKIRELDPENQIAVTMYYKAKVLLEKTRQPSPDRPTSTEALFDSTLEIEPVRKDSIRELQKQIENLKKQLEETQSADDAADASDKKPNDGEREKDKGEVNEPRTEIDMLRAIVQGLIGNLDELPQKPPVPLTGEVLATAKAPGSGNKFVGISLGSDDGLRKGVTLTVIRDGDYLGKLTITAVQSDRSVGRLTLRARDAEIRKGDVVTSSF